MSLTKKKKKKKTHNAYMGHLVNPQRNTNQDFKMHITLLLSKPFRPFPCSLTKEAEI